MRSAPLIALPGMYGAPSSKAVWQEISLSVFLRSRSAVKVAARALRDAKERSSASLAPVPRSHSQRLFRWKSLRST